MREEWIDIPFHLQLVSQQVDLKEDGILRRDFLNLMQARICYKERSLTFQRAGIVIHKGLRFLSEPESGAFQGVGVDKLTLPATTDLIVRLSVNTGSRLKRKW